MSKVDNCIKEFAEVLANVSDDDIEVIKIDASKLADKLRAKRFKEMIADTEKLLIK